MNLLKLKCIINKKYEKYYTVVYKRLSLLCVMKDVINLFFLQKTYLYCCGKRLVTLSRYNILIYLYLLVL